MLFGRGKVVELLYNARPVPFRTGWCLQISVSKQNYSSRDYPCKATYYLVQ